MINQRNKFGLKTTCNIYIVPKPVHWVESFYITVKYTNASNGWETVQL